MAILDDVKKALNVVGDYSDDELTIHISTVEDYMKNAGISDTAIAGNTSKGAIIRGVADLWNTNSGGVDFSPAFKDMVIQLAVTNQKESDS